MKSVLDLNAFLEDPTEVLRGGWISNVKVCCTSEKELLCVDVNFLWRFC
jgi:hypothetical protein